MIDDINKVKSETQAEPAKAEYTGTYLKTVIKNNRDSAVMLQDDKGGNWFPIPPGRELVLCSWSPTTMYAPFSKVVFERNGKVSAARRFGFKDPADDWPYSLLLDNRDGSELEVLKVNDDYVAAVRGIPRRVKIDLFDPRVGYRAIRWVKKTVKEPAPSNRDYLLTRTIVERRLIGRKASELRAIRKELEKQAVAEARQKADQVFKQIQPAEADDAEDPAD